MQALSHRKQQKGAVLILVTVAMFVLLGFTALALDGGHILLNKTRTQDAVDSAALSGAKTLSKTAAQGNSHNDARNAVYHTLGTLLTGSGLNQLNIDANQLAAMAEVEFSHQAVPFVATNDSSARFIRVSMGSVPVNQFFSQLFVNQWRVSSSAVAGPEAASQNSEDMQVIPLLLCAKDINDSAYGFTPSTQDSRGDVIVVKSNHHKNAPVGGGNFLALALNQDGPQGGCDEADPGADKYKKALAGDINPLSVVGAGQMVCTEPGNMTGPTAEGLNTRFGKDQDGKEIAGPSASPESGGTGAYYSDCAVPSFSPVTFDDLDFGGDVATGGNLVLSPSSSKWSQLQSYPDYYEGIHSTSPGLAQHCVDNRRIVKLPVANCANNQKNGRTALEVIDTVCMYLNQEVTGKGASPKEGQYIVAEMLESCDLGGGSGGGGSGGTSGRLVLYKSSGDS